MAKKATHFGECQVCGSRQKLPGGVLSLHGYTLDYGFFNGTCSGSGHLPYELSCDRIEGARDHAKSRAAELRAQAEALRTADYADTKTAMVSHYRKAEYVGSRTRPSGYEWREATLEPDANFYGVKYHFGPEGRETRGSFHNYDYDAKTFPALVRSLNSKYADHLDKVAAQADAYVAFANDRIRNWKLRDLTPISKAA